MTTSLRRLGVVLVAVGLGMPAGAQDDPLPSWNDGAAKSAIVDFVESVGAKPIIEGRKRQ